MNGTKLLINAQITQEVIIEGSNGVIFPVVGKPIVKENAINKNQRKAPKGAYSLRREFQNNQQDFQYAKHILGSLRKTGRLNHEETIEITTYTERYSEMSELKRANFFNFFSRVRDRINAKETV